MQYSTHIPKILEASEGALAKLPSILVDQKLNNIAIFLGDGILDLLGDSLLEPIRSEPRINVVLCDTYEELEICKLTAHAYSMPKEIQAIIGIGGGKAIDCAKYTAFLNGLPFFSVPTSISNDGFSSSGSSLLLEGKRVSVKSTMPYGIIADLNILKSAPEKFYFSGIGDIVSKVTAGYDWEREELLGLTQVNHFASMLAKKSVNSVVRLPFSYITEPLFIKEVVDSLIMSGVSMEIAGSSAPASGSEHLISHALDSILDKPCLHGIQVGMATYIMSIVQEHREARVEAFLSATGFFEFSKNCGLKKADFVKAIELAPQIKPERGTYIHDENYRIKAIEVVQTNEILNKILV